MLLDANDLPTGETLTADVCIAGAGAAGITLALALRDAGFEVILLESGDFEDDVNTQALYQGSMSGIDTWQLDDHRWRLFGGSTSRWAGWCRPMHPFDFERRPYIEKSGWPITYAELEPYYELAQARVELADFIYDLDTIQAASGRPVIESPSGRLRTEIYQYSPPTRFGEKYRADLEAAENVRVYLHANVRNIDLTSSHDQVKRFECVTLEGVRFNVEARAFVLALGGIENARLLLASNSQVPSGVANSSDCVGRYFMEHPHYLGVCIWVLSRPTDTSFYEFHDIDLPHGRVRVRAMLALAPDVLESEGLVDFSASIAETAVAPGDTGPIDAEQVRSLIRDREEERVYLLNVRAEQRPFRDSRITLRSDVDSLGMPRVDLKWQLHPEDNRSMRRAMELVGAELSAAGLGRMWTSTKKDELSWVTNPGGHHMGTVRMSEDPKEGAVDEHCRCHDVENLYIAGSAVFTTGGAPNPTLTVVALAERLAQHLKEQIG